MKTIKSSELVSINTSDLVSMVPCTVTNHGEVVAEILFFADQKVNKSVSLTKFKQSSLRWRESMAGRFGLVVNTRLGS